MPNVLVTHADEPLGRRIVKSLYHDPSVEHLLTVGAGPPPRAFDRFLADTMCRLSYLRADLARHRSVSDLFHSAALREAEIDTVVHVPRHGATQDDDTPVASGLPLRTAEARLLLQHCLEVRSIRHLVAIGSAFVYRLQPGNANRLCETSELDLDPAVPPELRSWIDCDMIFHGEVGADRLRVVLLRVPTVVASGGFVYLNPSLAGPARLRFRPVGFDPMCALVADKDVARAVREAVRSDRAGIYNISGVESRRHLQHLWRGIAAALGDRALDAAPHPARPRPAAPGRRHGAALDRRSRRLARPRRAPPLRLHPRHRARRPRAGLLPQLPHRPVPRRRRRSASRDLRGVAF
jgi:hypothetical protein